MPHAVLAGLRSRIAAVSALAIGGLALAAVPIAPAHAADVPTTVQVSVTTGGFAPDNGSNGYGGRPGRLSTDGRYVVFASSGPVIRGQAQLNWQIVRRDRQLGTSELISKSSSGVMGDGNSYDPSMSADGQVITFTSTSTNLVPGDTNAATDVFVHDVRTGITTRASVDSNGAQVPASVNSGNSVGPPSISADGRWVGFTAGAEGYTHDDWDDVNAYLHDRETGAIEVVSRFDDGTPRAAHVATPVTVSANGDFVTFQVLAANTAIQVFVTDRRPGQEMASIAVGGREWRDLRQSMTPDARFVVYDTGDDEQVPGEADTNETSDVFVHDRVAGTYERVSVSSTGEQSNGISTHGSISDDGRYVVFLSTASNLVPGDTNGEADVFRHDRQTGETIRVNVDDDGAQTTSATANPFISGDGQHVSFDSHHRLTPAATGGWQQVFVRDLTGAYPALFVRLGATPSRVVAEETYRISTRDIRTGPSLKIAWTPAGKGKVVKQTAPVANDAFSLRTPARTGQYSVTFHYAGHLLDTRTITVPKPGAKKLAKAVKKGKRLTIRTTGLKTGQQVKVVFNPLGKTGGKSVQRTARTNKSGIAKVAAAPRRGEYRVTVSAAGSTLRTGIVRVR